MQAGQYASGLAHYLAVGKARGYRPSAGSTGSAGAPTNLTATVAGSSVTLSWTAPLNAAVTSYLLEAGSSPGLSNLVRFPTGSAATSFSTSGVASGTYYVRVKTISGAATSGPSNEVVVTVGSAPCTAAPAAPSGLASSIAGSVVSLRWNASGGSPQSYVIEVGSSSGLADLARLDLGQAATTLTANAASGTYFVRVRATNACGTSNPSNEIVIVVP